MKKLIIPVLLFVFLCAPVFAAVVNPAPDFFWAGPAGHKTGLRTLRGQPVVLIIAKSTREHALRKQLAQLRLHYRDFASRNTVFALALEGGDTYVESNIPFIMVDDGAKVAADYGANRGFGIVVIGEDGNIDMATGRVTPAYRLRDIIENSFAVQDRQRR